MTAEKRPISVDDLYHIATIEDPRISPDGRWIAYVHVTVDRFENGYQRNIWLAPTAGGDPVQLTRSGKDSQPRWSPDGTTLAFVSTRDDKPQIYALRVTAPGGEARQITRMANGAQQPAWSPDGAQIAFLAPVNASEREQEDSGTEPAPPADKLDAQQREERREHDETQRYDPRVIERIPYREGTAYLDDRYAQIYIVDASKEDARPRRLTSVDASYDAPAWTLDGQHIVTGRTTYLDRDIPRRWGSLYRINVASGEEQQLTGDGHADSDPLVSPDGQWIAYVRLPDERRVEHILRLAVLPAAGGDPRDLNIALDRSVNEGSYRWSADSQSLVFTASSEGNTEIYRVNVPGGKVTKLVAGTFEATAIDLGADGSIAYAASTPANPSELMWRPANASESQQVTNANTEFLAQVIVQEVHELRFTSPSGTELQGWYLLPVGYEAGKTYPLAFNIHGGPYAMWGASTQSMWHEWQYHAACGYAVFYCNPRGAAGYGEAFQMALHSAWGDVAYPDLMAGVDAVIEQGFVDTNRLAVTGGSYGGYMTAWIVGHTDRFATAVSQRGVYNLMSFYGATDIPLFLVDQYEATPTQDPTRLWQQSPLAYADNITTPLLIIHSENDFRVPITDADQLFAYIKLRGGEVKYVRFPRDGHELSRSGEPAHRLSRLQHMMDWFDRYCK